MVLANSDEAVRASAAGDYAAAVEQANAAIAGGDLRGYEILAGLYVAGQGVEQDTQKGLQLLEEGAKKGSPGAAVKLGKLLRALERGGGPGEGRTFDLWRHAAEQGYGPAQYLVAKEYELLYVATTRPEHRNAALSWYRKAVSAADPAQEEEISVTGNQMFCDIAYRIESSLESPPDAFGWYERCAYVGCAAGMERLAQAYANGELGRPADLPSADSWLERSQNARPEACLN